MLRPMDPVDAKVDQKQCEDYFDDAGQRLEIVNVGCIGGGGEAGCEISNSVDGETIDRERKGEGENVEFEIDETVDGARGTDPFAELENQY